MPGCEKDWIDILTALMTPLIALIATYIAYMQWEMADKLRKNTFAKQYFKNYQRITRALESVLEHGTVKSDAMGYFWEARDEARLFLAEEIAEYTENLRSKAQAAYSIDIGLEGLSKGKERSKKVEERSKIVAELLAEKPHDTYRRHTNIS